MLTPTKAKMEPQTFEVTKDKQSIEVYPLSYKGVLTGDWYKSKQIDLTASEGQILALDMAYKAVVDAKGATITAKQSSNPKNYFRRKEGQMTLEERIPIKVLFDRKDAAEWQKLNPVVDDGELVVELDTHRLKVGDGKLNYNDLPYYEGPQGESITKVQLSENGDLSVWIGDKETKLGNIKGQKGDKGTSIADITKVGETLTITLSDDTQKTFSIPNGQKGDRGKGVESARVDEEGNLFVKFEEESEKLVGNIKGQKGDKGDSLKFEDLTSDQIAQIKAKDVDLSAYATKAELKEIDVSKQLADYLSKAEANSTYAKASHKHSLSDITDLNLDRYATKIELQNKASTYHRHRTSDIDGIDEYLKQTDLPQDIVKQSDIRDVVRNAQLSGYVRLADIQYQLNNIGKLKDVATGQYLSVRVVDKGKVPYNTSGLIVFERSGGK
ncbi:hypothetical protein HMPREF1226_0027 [Streptococcus pyogenes UTMEM-1]|nr:hypothetical protein HMPREF1226_0027 [Streptococcus pyogenes UTMEM-1]